MTEKENKYRIKIYDGTLNGFEEIKCNLRLNDTNCFYSSIDSNVMNYRDGICYKPGDSYQ